MTKVATKKEENTQVSTNLNPPMAEDGSSYVNSNDTIIPRIHLMQGLSKLVEEEKAKTGEFVNSQNEEVICPRDTALRFTPVKFWKTWVKLEANPGGKDKYIEEFPYTPTNCNLPREQVEEGKLIKYMETHNHLVLLNKDIEAYSKALENGDDDAILWPYLLSLKSTGLMASKSILSEMQKFKMASQMTGKAQKEIFHKYFELSSEKKENDKGTFYIPKVKYVDKSNEQALVAGGIWLDNMKSTEYEFGKDQLQDSDDEPKQLNNVPAGDTLDIDV